MLAVGTAVEKISFWSPELLAPEPVLAVCPGATAEVSEPEPRAAANSPPPAGAPAIKVDPCPEVASTGVATSTVPAVELTNESTGVLTSVIVGVVTVEVVGGVTVTVTWGAVRVAWLPAMLGGTGTGAGAAIEVVAGPAEMVFSSELLVEAEPPLDGDDWEAVGSDPDVEGCSAGLVVEGVADAVELELESVDGAASALDPGVEDVVSAVGAASLEVGAGSVAAGSLAGAAVEGAGAASTAAGALAPSELAVVAGAEVESVGALGAGAEAGAGASEVEAAGAGVEAAGVVAAGVDAAGAAADCGVALSLLDVLAGAGADGVADGPVPDGPAGDEPPLWVPPAAPPTSWAWLPPDALTVTVGAGGGLLATGAVDTGGGAGIGGGGGAMFVTTGAEASALASALTLLDDEVFLWCGGGASEYELVTTGIRCPTVRTRCRERETRPAPAVRLTRRVGTPARREGCLTGRATDAAEPWPAAADATPWPCAAGPLRRG